MSRAVLLLVLLLGGCAAHPAGLCQPLAPWSAADQDALADELAHAGPLTLQAIDQWEGMRAAERACRH